MADREVPIRVALVDDSVQLRYMMAMFMELDPRFEVVGQAGDGVDALAMLADAAPDLLLLDVEMPRMNGLEVLEHLDPDLPPLVVMLSGVSGELGERQSLARGAVAYLEKDADPAGLLDRLVRIVDDAANTADA